MTKAEYKKIIQDIDFEKKKVVVRYACQNNMVEIGQAITDGSSTIKVEAMEPYIGYQEEPTMKYTGYRLTKSGKLHQNLKKATIYQCNLQLTK